MITVVFLLFINALLSFVVGYSNGYKEGKKFNIKKELQKFELFAPEKEGKK